jgi:asparagine synthetase B (glutamine-hydrolysing)
MSWAEKERVVERNDKTVETDEIYEDVQNLAMEVESFSKIVSRLLNQNSVDTKKKSFSDCFSQKTTISKKIDKLHEQVNNTNDSRLKLQLKKITTQFTALDSKLQVQKETDLRKGNIRVRNVSSNIFDDYGEEQIIWEEEKSQMEKPKSKLTGTQAATLNVERLIALETQHQVQELEEEFKELNSKTKNNSLTSF